MHIAYIYRRIQGFFRIAESIAKSVRYINGGFRYVRAIGLELSDEGMVQVCMSLTHYEKTPIPMVVETVKRKAARYGVSVAGTELVGPIPCRYPALESAQF